MNTATILILLLIVVAATAAAYLTYKQRKSGQNGCSHCPNTNCSGCRQKRVS